MLVIVMDAGLGFGWEEWTRLERMVVVMMIGYSSVF